MENQVTALRANEERSLRKYEKALKLIENDDSEKANALRKKVNANMASIYLKHGKWGKCGAIPTATADSGKKSQKRAILSVMNGFAANLGIQCAPFNDSNAHFKTFPLKESNYSQRSRGMQHSEDKITTDARSVREGVRMCDVRAYRLRAHAEQSRTGRCTCGELCTQKCDDDEKVSYMNASLETPPAKDFGRPYNYVRRPRGMEQWYAHQLMDDEIPTDMAAVSAS